VGWVYSLALAAFMAVLLIVVLNIATKADTLRVAWGIHHFV